MLERGFVMTNQHINEFITYITFRCNFACKMCTQEGIDKKKELSAKEWDKIFADIEKNYPESILIILGGEPTLHKDFEKILKNAVKRNISTHIVTNGSLLEKNIPIIRKNFCGVTVSIDGIGETHDRIRNFKGAFERAEKALAAMDDINQHHLIQDEMPIWFNINFVMLPDNIDEIYDFVERMRQYHPTEIVLNHPRYVSTEKDEEMQSEMKKLYTHPYTHRLMMRQDTSFSPEYVHKLNEIIKDVKAKYPGFVKEFPELTEQERLDYYDDTKAYDIKNDKKCLSPYKIPFFFPDGTVASCLYNVLGNATKEPISKIWNNKIAEETREYLDCKNKFPTCARCTCFYKEECEEENP